MRIHAMAFLTALSSLCCGDASAGSTIRLPQPTTAGSVSLEETLQARRSRRSYTEETVTLEELSQLLWAAQGLTSPRGYRASPSAGALYPLETLVVASSIDSLPPGVYRYLPSEHALVRESEADLTELAEAALGQGCVREAAAVIVLAAVYERVTDVYGTRGKRYVHMEVGHTSQNIYLQCETLGLGTVAVGAFEDSEVAELLGLPSDQKPLYLMPVGRPR
ncbi:SagB/ThcOx family dehydrogenase [Candidatus Fermentibacteria bacterium]|nr:SagB/ThcOx family dehydrogenase [Candidatus Fermentibacteria bacterium]